MSDKRVGDLSGWRRFLSSKELADAYPAVDESDFVWDDAPPGVKWVGVSANAALTSGMALSHFNTPFGPVDAADLAWSTLVDIVRGLQVVATANTYLDLGAYYSIRKAFDTAIEPLLNNGRYTNTSEAGLSDIFEWLMAHHSPSKQDIAAALLKDYHITKREKA